MLFGQISDNLISEFSLVGSWSDMDNQWFQPLVDLTQRVLDILVSSHFHLTAQVSEERQQVSHVFVVLFEFLREDCRRYVSGV